MSGARSEGLAHASVSVLDVFSTFHNPSLLAWNDENWLGLSGRNNFSVSSMNSAYGSLAFMAGKSGNAGMNFQYNGNSGFYDVRAGGYFAKGFGENLGLPTYVDGVGNVIISKPATVGMENRKMVVLEFMFQS